MNLTELVLLNAIAMAWIYLVVFVLRRSRAASCTHSWRILERVIAPPSTAAAVLLVSDDEMRQQMLQGTTTLVLVCEHCPERAREVVVGAPAQMKLAEVKPLRRDA